jgi:hypothetical protein
MHTDIPLPRTEISAADVEFAVNCVYLFVRGAGYAELRELFDAKLEPYRQRLIALVRDVLSDYPTMTFGVPMLIYVESSDCVHRPLRLPLPDYQPPDTNIESCAWLGLNTLRSPIDFGKPAPVTVFTSRVAGAVLLLRCRTEDPPRISDEWYGDVFNDLPGHVSIHTLAPMPWPDAVEAAAAMLVNARAVGVTVDSPQVFLDFGLHFAAQDVGRRFYRRVVAQAGTSSSSTEGTPDATSSEEGI